jgi:glycosyltransferase involved in cell wall biosynthesis
MRILSTSYSNAEEFDNPENWLRRISFYTGILDELARQHDVISIERINFKGTLRRNDVQYYFMPLTGAAVLFPWRMHRFIKKQHPDLVLVHGFIFPFQIIQLRWVLGQKTKIIVQNHAERPASGLKKIFQKVADRYISAYLFTSAEMGMEWVEKRIIGCSKKIVEVMEVSSPFYATGKNAGQVITHRSRGTFFLWVGRLNANKDPLTVVKAFINFLCFQPAAKLYMVYQAEELLPQIIDLINSNVKAKEAIELLGKIPNQQMQQWYNRADFFISGSHYEGSGVAVCEAMASGCVPILTDILSFRKITGYGRCGLMYEPGNDNALLQSLLKTEEMEIEKERKKVLKQFKEELSFEAIAARINERIAPWSLP